MLPDTQTELERLREEVAELRKALTERSTPSVPGFVVDDTPNLPALRNDFEFVLTLTRFSEGLTSEAAVRKLYRLTEADWELLGKDDELVRAIDAEKIRRVRDGSFKRERSQQHITKAPDILNEIMSDAKQSAKHRIDSAKVLDSFSGTGPKDAPESDRILIRIDLGADVRAKGQESNPADVLVIETEVRPNPNPNDTQPIDSWDAPKHLDLDQQEPPPPKRGPGRPPGSKNKPKLDQQQPLPGFRIDADHL